ncbi:MAG: alpha/beta fold hydrolase [Deltaproteobacteria bacterium]|nr:alpha/beta fold hydrolase [Deltaproteobacteria bacterium]
MPIQRIKKFGKGIQEDLKILLTYFKLSLSGNKVDRRTNFRKCSSPVLLIYGFGAGRRVMHILERRLRRDGFCVFSLNLGGVFGTFNTHCIEALSKLVKRKIKTLRERYRLPKISIIGHSKGGLIGQYYVKRLQGDRHVKTLITLGTPHYGNPLVLLGLVSPLAIVSKSVWQMYPLAPFLRRLNRGRFPKNVRFVSIYSKKDKICYYKSAILKIPRNTRNMKNIELENIGHVDYLIKKEAYQVIRRELTTSS